MNNRIINSYVENFCGQNDFDSNKFLLFSKEQREIEKIEKEKTKKHILLFQ